MQARATFLKLHRWAGVGLALFLLLQGLSGTAIAFQKEFNLLLHGRAMRVDQVGPLRPVADLLAAVRAAHPGAAVTRIEYPAAPDQAFLFRVQDKASWRLVSVDPYAGAILHSSPLAAWPVEFLYQWHDNMLLGDAGQTIVGGIGLCFLLMAATGLALWWPTNRWLKRGFNVVLKSGSFRAVLDLHRVGGAVLAILLLVVAGTGVGMAWRAYLLPVLSPVMPATPFPAPALAEPGAFLLPLDRIVEQAQSATGGLPVRSVRFPGGDGRMVLIFLEDTGAGRPRAARRIWADGHSGDILADYSAATAPTGNLLLDWMLPIHSGAIGGLAGRLLVLAAGLGLAGLAGTGLWLWQRKRNLRRKAALQRQPAR